MVGTYLDDEDALIENYGSSGPNIRRLLPVHERITRHTRLMCVIVGCFNGVFHAANEKGPFFLERALAPILVRRSVRIRTNQCQCPKYFIIRNGENII